ncbi:MAG: DUF1329 domain-containing protein [Telluria sp.]|nr:DUF1329 domain-containing protein [Telluria sp.]
MTNKLLIGALAASLLASHARAATEADLDKVFSPYKNGVPTVAGLVPGTVINKANVKEFANAIDPGTRAAIEKGWYEITVGETLSFDPAKKYIEETRRNLNKARLSDQIGNIVGYEGGLPFPEEPKTSDARAGEKLAWNFKYNYGAGDGSSYSPFFYKFRTLNTDKTERTIKFSYNVQKHKFRVNQEPLGELAPNPSQLFRSFYIKVTEPQDVKDTQLLIQRYLDDTKLDDAYLYLGFQRRVRRLSTGQTTDPFLGTDLMIEDFEGYNARVSDAKWKYIGTQTILLPMYKHNGLKLASEDKEPDGYQFVAGTGKGSCFVNVSWQLRKVYVLEGTPVNASNPVGKRVFYVDAQTFTFPQTLIYDRKGELWKTWTIGLAHPDFHLPVNKGSGVPLFDSFSMIDVQSSHCTVGLIKGQVVQPAQKIFTVQQMRGGTN